MCVQLDEEGIKEKRRQKLMRAGFEARQRAQRERERERAQREGEAQREQQEREKDLDAWISRIRQEHQVYNSDIFISPSFHIELFLFRYP